MIDRPADLLYRQLEKLKAAGFVVETGVRKRGRHAERLFDVAADDFGIDFQSASGDAEASALVATGRSLCTGAARTVEDSARAGALRINGADRNFVINYEVSWLSPPQYQRVRALMYQIKQLMDEARAQREGRLYMSMTVVAPVTRRGRRAGGATGLATKPASSRTTGSTTGPTTGPTSGPAGDGPPLS